MVIVAGPVVAELLAVSVSRLLPVVGLVAKAAVTPLGIPDAVRVTAPVNPPASITLMVSVLPASNPIVSAGAEGARVKLPPEPVTVSGMVVAELSVPEVPVTVIVPVVAVAPLASVIVITLVDVAGLGLNEAE
jgi:hypothetical protein